VNGNADETIMGPIGLVFFTVMILDVVLTNIYIMKRCMVK